VNQDKETLDEILRTDPRDQIVNTDETTWKLLNHGFMTLVETGTETVNCFFEGDSKMCLTATAAIDAAGGKLPM
jgi:hypothetical protein